MNYKHDFIVFDEAQDIMERLRTASLALGISLQSATEAFRSVSQNEFLESDVREALRKHAEEMRWQQDPLEIKARFIDPVVGDLRNAVVSVLRLVGDGLNALADWVEDIE